MGKIEELIQQAEESKVRAEREEAARRVELQDRARDFLKEKVEWLLVDIGWHRWEVKLVDLKAGEVTYYVDGGAARLADFNVFVIPDRGFMGMGIPNNGQIYGVRDMSDFLVMRRNEYVHREKSALESKIRWLLNELEDGYGLLAAERIYAIYEELCRLDPVGEVIYREKVDRAIEKVRERLRKEEQERRLAKTKEIDLENWKSALVSWWADCKRVEGEQEELVRSVEAKNDCEVDLYRLTYSFEQGPEVYLMEQVWIAPWPDSFGDLYGYEGYVRQVENGSYRRIRYTNVVSIEGPITTRAAHECSAWFYWEGVYIPPDEEKITKAKMCVLPVMPEMPQAPDWLNSFEVNSIVAEVIKEVEG